MKIKIPEIYNNLQVEGCFTWKKESKFFQEVIEIVEPKNILETGFFRGASAFMWLYISKANLTSVDPMASLYDPSAKHDGMLENVDKLKKEFGERFTFIQKDSKIVRPDLIGKKFDLFFIDGDHWEQGIRNDFQLAIDLEIDWIFVDDFVTSVAHVYLNEFQDKFIPVKIYNRDEIFQGRPIPIVLLKRIKNEAINNKVEYENE